MAPTETPTAQLTETAQRLRATLGVLSRLLRATDTGSAKDLTPTRVSVLLTADRHGPVRLGDLAKHEGLNPTLLSRTVASLVEAGLIERIADNEDRRSAWVTATRQGHEVVEGVRHDRMVAVRAALAELDTADQERIDAVLPALERFTEVLRGQRPEGQLQGGRV